MVYKDKKFLKNSNNAVKSKFEISDSGIVAKKFLLNQDFDCSKWPSSLNIGHKPSKIIPMSLYQCKIIGFLYS